MTRHRSITVVLINPYYAEGGNNGWSFAGEHLFSTDQVAGHLGLGYVAASLRAGGIDAEVIDGDLRQLPADAISRMVNDRMPDLAGVTVCHDTYLSAKAVVDRLHADMPGLPIVVGGPLARVAGRRMQKLFPTVDAFVLGEGEQAIHDVIAQLGDANVRRPTFVDAGPAPDPGDLPFPLRDDLPVAMARQEQLGLPTSVNLLSSRGCPGKCSFCTIGDYGRANPEELLWRPRSAANVVDEMELLDATHAPQCQFFMDDIFLCGARGHERARDMAAEIRRRRLKLNFTFSCRVQDIRKETLAPLREAGLYAVSFGVETIDTGSLRLLNKATRLEAFQRAFSVLEDLDIAVSTYMMLYHPYTSIREIALNFEFLKAIGSLDFTVSPDRKAFELLFQCKTTVRRFGALEAELGERGLLKQRSLADSLPLIADYDFADPEVAAFLDRLNDRLYRGDRSNLVALFEDTLAQFAPLSEEAVS